MNARGRRNTWLGVGVGLLTLLLLLYSAGDYGLTFDEPVYASRSAMAGQWLGLLFTAPRVALQRETVDHLWNAAGDEQAGLVKLLAYPASAVTAPFVPILGAVRAATALLVAVLIACLFAVLANHRGRLEAAFACLGLLFMPRVFAHCHLLTMDAPVMVFSTLALLAAYAAATHGPERRRRCWLSVALLGLAFGGAIACKANGWLIPLIVLPWLLFVRRRVFLPALVSLVILGPLVFIGTWPWLWFDTGERVARYFSFFGKHYAVGVQYFGHVWGTAPWHYAPVMIAITTPVVVLVLAAVGVWRGLRRGGACAGALADRPLRTATATAGGAQVPGCRSALQQGGVGEREFLLLMLWAFVVHLAPVLLPSSPKYNGVRLFLPVFPPLAILAAAGFGLVARRLTRSLAKEARDRRLVLVLLLLLALLPQVFTTVTTHPFGMSYYNLLIGGPSGAARAGMEPTYWGDTFFAAVPWLNQNATQGAQVWINVAGFVSSFRMYQSFGLLRPDLQITGGDDAVATAAYKLVMNKPTEYGTKGRELVQRGGALYVKELDGVPLLWIF